MNKWKNLLIFLLTAVLIITGAFLPRITGAIADQMRSSKVHTAPIQSVQLNLNSNTANSMIQKLSIRSEMHTIPITAEDASMTEDEVFAAVEACMDMYVSNKIFSWFEETYRTAEPHLAINPNNTKDFFIFWAVNFVEEKDPYNNLFLHLDDETGQILYIDYVTYDPDKSYFPEDQSYVVDTFSGLYFEQLGLSDLADPDFSENVTLDEMISNDVWSKRYTFSGLGTDTFSIEFYVKPKGFYILFPD